MQRPTAPSGMDAIELNTTRALLHACKAELVILRAAADEHDKEMETQKDFSAQLLQQLVRMTVQQRGARVTM